jgi:signal transduction histidine kinase
LSASAAFYEPIAEERGVQVTTEAVAGISGMLDRTLLQRALGNLIANSLAHTPRGGRVTLRAARDVSGLRIEVEDNGTGIAREQLPYVFDRFYRADDARTISSGRVGLGLALVKSIAALHGGTAEIESAPNRGTLVRLSFPDVAALPTYGKNVGNKPGRA